MNSVNDAEELYESMELGPYIPERIALLMIWTSNL